MCGRKLKPYLNLAGAVLKPTETRVGLCSRISGGVRGAQDGGESAGGAGLAAGGEPLGAAE